MLPGRRVPARRAAARCPSRRSRRGRPPCWVEMPGGPVRGWAPTDRASPTTASAPVTRAARRGLPDRPRPGERRRAPRLHRGRRLPAPRALDATRGGAGAQREGRRGAAALGARRRGRLARPRLRPRRAGRPGPRPVPRQRPRGRRPRALGRAPACPPRRSGSAAAPGAPATARRANLDQLAFGTGLGRRLPARPERLPADARRRLGVDRDAPSRATRASAPSPTASTPRSSSAGATGCCAAGRGRPSRSPPGRASATGTCPSAARSSAACAWRGTCVTTRSGARAPYRLDVHPLGSGGRGLAEDARDGLAATPKSLPPKHFYDERGSDLFERITRLPEYYQSRAELRILRAHRHGVVAPPRRRRAGRARLRAPRARRAALLDAMRDARTPATGTCPSTSAPRRSSRRRGRLRGGLPGPRPPRRGRRLRPSPARGARPATATARGWSPSSAGRSATSSREPAPRSSARWPS